MTSPCWLFFVTTTTIILMHWSSSTVTAQVPASAIPIEDRYTLYDPLALQTFINFCRLMKNVSDVLVQKERIFQSDKGSVALLDAKIILLNKDTMKTIRRNALNNLKNTIEYLLDKYTTTYDPLLHQMWKILKRQNEIVQYGTQDVDSKNTLDTLKQNLATFIANLLKTMKAVGSWVKFTWKSTADDQQTLDQMLQQWSNLLDDVKADKDLLKDVTYQLFDEWLNGENVTLKPEVERSILELVSGLIESIRAYNRQRDLPVELRIDDKLLKTTDECLAAFAGSLSEDAFYQLHASLQPLYMTPKFLSADIRAMMEEYLEVVGGGGGGQQTTVKMEEAEEEEEVTEMDVMIESDSTVRQDLQEEVSSETPTSLMEAEPNQTTEENEPEETEEPAKELVLEEVSTPQMSTLLNEDPSQEVDSYVPTTVEVKPAPRTTTYLKPVKFSVPAGTTVSQPNITRRVVPTARPLKNLIWDYGGFPLFCVGFYFITATIIRRIHDGKVTESLVNLVTESIVTAESTGMMMTTLFIGAIVGVLLVVILIVYIYRRRVVVRREQAKTKQPGAPKGVSATATSSQLPGPSQPKFKAKQFLPLRTYIEVNSNAAPTSPSTTLSSMVSSKKQAVKKT